MKANRAAVLLMFLMLGVTAAQQTNSTAGITNGTAFIELKVKAEKGDAISQNALGMCFEMVKDDIEAIKWFRKAAEQNYTVAQFQLGWCYEHGLGVRTDYAESLRWYRKAADQNYAYAQFNLGNCYANGVGVAKNYMEATKWYRKAAEQKYASAEYNLGLSYLKGLGVETNNIEAVKWFRKAAEQNVAPAQFNLGCCYVNGDGVPKDYSEAFKWHFKAADQGEPVAQCIVGNDYLLGFGIPKDNIEAYKWLNLSVAQGNQTAKSVLEFLEKQMTPEQVADAQKLTREYKPGASAKTAESPPNGTKQEQQLTGNGTGFFITDDGYLISNYHVVKDAAKVRLLTSAGLLEASVVKVDAANDLALLHAVGRFIPLPIASSRTVTFGSTVTTVGFPDIGLQGFAPKLAKGEIASMAGAADDPRYFQISLPVQPGNSGGALVDSHGNVVGIVAAKLDASAALAATGALPENVNYAVKSSLLLSFLESVPDVGSKLKEPNTKDEPFEDVVKSAKDAAVLVLVY
jgi:TPR repeat protein